MSGLTKKIVSLFVLLVLAFSVAGCSYDSDYFLESTSDAVPVRESTSASTSLYVRSSFDENRYPYFSMLSETEKNMYSLIYEELSKGNQKFECPISVTADQLTRAVDSVLNDHPELFWIDNNYGYSYDPVDGSILEINFVFFDFADTPEKLKNARLAFESAADAIVSKSLPYAKLAERELFIHDYICEHTEYDVEAPYNQSAYSVLVLHRSVCAGYARSFQYLMQKAGFTCYYVTGRTDVSTGRSVDGRFESGAHSWNMVLLNGDFYNVDCLWDDTASENYGSSIYPFFNITDNNLLHHQRTGMAISLPGCTATEYKYSNQFGPTIEVDSIVFDET